MTDTNSNLKRLVTHIQHLNKIIKDQNDLIETNNLEYFMDKIDKLSQESTQLRLVNTRIQDQLNKVMEIMNGDTKLDRKQFAKQLVNIEQQYLKELDAKDKNHKEQTEKMEHDYIDKINYMKKQHLQDMNILKIEYSRQFQDTSVQYTQEKTQLDERLINMQQVHQQELINVQNKLAVKYDTLKSKFEEKIGNLQAKHERTVSETKEHFDKVIQDIKEEHGQYLVNVESRHSTELASISLQHTNLIQDIQYAHENELKRQQLFQQEKAETEMAQMKEKFDNLINKMVNDHSLEIQQLNREKATIKVELQRQLEVQQSDFERMMTQLKENHANDIYDLKQEIKTLGLKKTSLMNEIELKNDYIEQLTTNIEQSHLQLNTVVSKKHQLESQIVDLKSQSTALTQHYQHSMKMLEEKDQIVLDGQSKLKVVTEHLTSEISAIKKGSNQSWKSFSVFAEDFDDWIEKRDHLAEKTTDPSSNTLVNHNMIITGMELD